MSLRQETQFHRLAGGDLSKTKTLQLDLFCSIVVHNDFYLKQINCPYICNHAENCLIKRLGFFFFPMVVFFDEVQSLSANHLLFCLFFFSRQIFFSENIPITKILYLRFEENGLCHLPTFFFVLFFLEGKVRACPVFYSAGLSSQSGTTWGNTLL